VEGQIPAQFYQTVANCLKMSQNILQIGQESYQLLVESVNDHAIFMVDTEGHILNWNKGAEDIKGYSADEAIGKHISIFYTNEQKELGEPQRNLQMAKEMGQFQEEGWQVRKDGSTFWADVTITALKNDEGEVVGYAKVTRDMTRRRKIEDEIKGLNKQLEDRLQKTQSEIADYKHALDESSIVAITDQKGIIKHVNENFCRISKYSKAELIGQDHRIINSGYHSKEFIRNLWVTIANGKIWRGELKNRAKDGSYYWVDTTIVPFLNEHGKPYQYLAIRSDITQRKVAEEELLKHKGELEKKVVERTLELTEALSREKELNEMKSRFVSMASHEFRTPLSAILSSTSLLEHYTAAEHVEKRAKHIDRIKASIKNLTAILDDFLSLEKLEQGKVEVHSIEFNLKDFIEDVIDEMDGMLKKKDQKVKYSYVGETEVCQDKKILRNVLLNLLSNAIKYSPDGKEIDIVVEVKNHKVNVFIKDEGIGIPLEAQKDLFGKFFRATNVSNIQGTGLGLNIVKRYIELLEGNISFTSTEHKGTTFTIQIPQRKN
jgi:PAS domain S-box-containing protein